MSTKKSAIRKALRTHLLNVSGLPDLDLENRLFEPVEATAYIRETIMQADETLTANNERTALGVYQLTYFEPINEGTKTAEDKCDEIKHHFRPGQTIGNNVVLEKAWVGQGNRESVWYVIPIQIRYRAFQLNNQAFDLTFDETFA